MSRRNTYRSKHTEIELFPFLSVLVCTIGTLILFIVVLTSQNLDPQEAVVVAKGIVQTQKDAKGKGANKTKVPLYIECRQDGFILHPNKEFAPRADIYDKKSPLSKMIASLKANKDKQYLIVILRPDGIEMFNKLRGIVQEQGIDIGYEPLEFGLELKLENLAN